MKLHRPILVALTVILAFGLVSCAKKAKEPTAGQKERRDELAQVFMEELRVEILPLRKTPEQLDEMELLVSREESVAELSLLEDFLKSYKDGSDCSLTACFITKSFVVARLQVERGVGYYFRYQYDENSPISVSSKIFDDVAVTEDEKLGKTLLKLKYDGSELASFTFRPEKK